MNARSVEIQPHLGIGMVEVEGERIVIGGDVEQLVEPQAIARRCGVAVGMVVKKELSRLDERSVALRRREPQGQDSQRQRKSALPAHEVFA